MVGVSPHVCYCETHQLRVEAEALFYSFLASTSSALNLLCSL